MFQGAAPCLSPGRGCETCRDLTAVWHGRRANRVEMLFGMPKCMLSAFDVSVAPLNDEIGFFSCFALLFADRSLLSTFCFRAD